MSATKISPEEVQRSALEIATALRKVFQWFGTKPQAGLPTVQTNVGLFAFYGTTTMQPSGEGPGGVIVTTPKPHSYHLSVVSHLPTTGQKVAILDMLALAISRELGAKADAMVDRYDPIKNQLNASEHIQRAEQGEGAIQVDPYKTIEEPFVISVFWPVPGGSMLMGTRQIIQA